MEGYAGSAILIDLCDRMKRIALPADGKVILVHVMNPHGMREWRRWNHNNVDLNRNNGISQLDFMERANNPDPTYVKYNDFINPSRRISVCDCFAAPLMPDCTRGFSNGKQALAGGSISYAFRTVLRRHGMARGTQGCVFVSAPKRA